MMTARCLTLLTFFLVAMSTISHPSFCAEDDSQTTMRVVATDDGYEFFEGESPILHYQAMPRSLNGKFERAGYVHPLHDLDGNVLTEDFPPDHLHHRGVFWAWHQLYVGDTQVGDPWICRDFLARVDSVKVLKSEPDSAGICATVHWVSPDRTTPTGELKPIIREETTIRTFRSDGSHRMIDFRIALVALEPSVRIGGSDDAKGYGGFSPRLRLPQDIRFIAEQGEVEPLKTAVNPSRWMDMVGSFSVDPTSGSGTTSGVTVLCHPSLPGFPHKWILRKTRSMQNPAFPGREPVPVPTDKPLELRYRIIVHRGEASAQQLAKWFANYSAE
jgi:hypothetical protein